MIIKFLLCDKDDEGESNDFFQSNFDALLKKVPDYLTKYLHVDYKNYKDDKFYFEVDDGAGSAKILADFLVETDGNIEVTYEDDFDYRILIER